MNAKTAAGHARGQALADSTSTPALCVSLRSLRSQEPGPERNLMMHWTETALTSRYPAARAALDAAYDEFERVAEDGGDLDAVDFDPVDVVLGAVPAADQV